MNKNLVFVVGVFVAILGFCFYWFEYRPNTIKRQCWKVTPSTLEGGTEKNYKACLIDRGIVE